MNDGWMNVVGWIDGGCEWMNDRWMRMMWLVRWMNVCCWMVGWMDGCGWMDGSMDQSMDGWMDR